MRRILGLAIASSLVAATPVAAQQQPPALGAPGQRTVWTAADKHGFGTAHTRASELWFTLRQRELTEVYYPDLGTPALRELQFAVASGARVQRETDVATGTVRRDAGLAYTQTTRDPRGRWRAAQALRGRSAPQRAAGAGQPALARRPAPPALPARRSRPLQRRRRRPRRDARRRAAELGSRRRAVAAGAAGADRRQQRLRRPARAVAEPAAARHARDGDRRDPRRQRRPARRDRARRPPRQPLADAGARLRARPRAGRPRRERGSSRALRAHRSPPGRRLARVPATA